MTDGVRTRGVRNQTRNRRRRIRRGGRHGKGPVDGNHGRAATDVAVRPILLPRKDPGLRFLPLPTSMAFSERGVNHVGRAQLGLRHFAHQPLTEGFASTALGWDDRDVLGHVRLAITRDTYSHVLPHPAYPGQCPRWTTAFSGVTGKRSEY